MIIRIFKISAAIVLAGILVTSTWSFNSLNGQAKSTLPQSDSREISIEANYVSYSDVEQLDQMSDLIVIGTPTKSFKERKHVSTYFDDGTLQDFYTLTELKIDRIIKGPDDFKHNKSLIIVEPIGSVEIDSKKTKITYEGYTELQAGQKSIIFLKKNSFGEYSVINMNLGKFNIEQNLQTQSGDAEAVSKEKFRQTVLEKYDLTKQ